MAMPHRTLVGREEEITYLKKLLDDAILGKGRIVSFFPLVRVCRVPEAEVTAADPAGLSFVNVNTPEDLERLRRLDAGLTLP
jgi:molybdopterin-guanine dinucleotide biosynthesis protein A